MLEALITRDTGAVIVVAPAGKVWGDFEKEYFRVVPWQDDDLGEVVDVVVYPYDPNPSDPPPSIVRRAWNFLFPPKPGPGGVLKWVDVSAIDLSGTDPVDFQGVSAATRSV